MSSRSILVHWILSRHHQNPHFSAAPSLSQSSLSSLNPFLLSHVADLHRSWCNWFVHHHHHQLLQLLLQKAEWCRLYRIQFNHIFSRMSLNTNEYLDSNGSWLVRCTNTIHCYLLVRYANSILFLKLIKIESKYLLLVCLESV